MMKKVSSISTNPSKDSSTQKALKGLTVQDLQHPDTSRKYFDEVAPELNHLRHGLTVMSYPTIDQESVLGKTLSIKKQ